MTTKRAADSETMARVHTLEQSLAAGERVTPKVRAEIVELLRQQLAGYSQALLEQERLLSPLPQHRVVMKAEKAMRQLRELIAALSTLSPSVGTPSPKVLAAAEKANGAVVAAAEAQRHSAVGIPLRSVKGLELRPSMPTRAIGGVKSLKASRLRMKVFG